MFVFADEWCCTCLDNAIDFVRFCLLCSKLESVKHCLWRKQLHDAIHSSRTFGSGMLYCLTFTPETPLEIYLRLGDNLKTDSCWWKLNSQFTSWCLGWSLAMVMLYLHSSSHMVSDSIQRPVLSFWRRYWYSALRGWLLEDSTPGNRTLHHATLAGKPSVDCEKISVTISPLTSTCLIHKVAIPLITICGAWLRERERETNKTLCNTKDGLKARIIATFIYLNKETIGKIFRRFQTYLEAVVEANGNFLK